ncbi:MAG: hypothetical protein U0984_03200, partial [Prosthecobacter sp.]|nr:hypothetical protein [Prosthecobacter sp.]
SRVFALTLPGAVLETVGVVPNGGSVSLAFTVETALTVDLMSADTNELTVPSQVIIPANASSVSFDLAFQDEAVADGPRTVQVSAAAAGFVTGIASVTVNDDETPALPSNPSPANGAASINPETDLAWQAEADGGVPDSFDVYFGTNAAPSATEFIGNSVTAVRALPRLTPSTTYYWRIVARKGAATRAGAVWSFTVAPVGPPKRFEWEPMPSVVSADGPFSARVTAYDEYDNPVTNFSGNAALSTIGGGPETTTGTGTLLWEFPFATYFHDARTQSIYLPSEVGPAGSLTSLALDVATLPGQTLNNFTIRMRHTTKAVYSSGSQQNWENTGWTTVYQSNKTVTSTGWNWFVFTTPFDYDGTSNLMVDISFNNNSYTTYGQSRATPASTLRSLCHLTDSNYGDPLTWVGTLPYGTMSYSLPNLRFRRSEFGLPISPSGIGPFSNGTWSGDLTLALPGGPIRILAQLASDNTVFGLSDPFDVVAAPAVTLNAEPLFTGGATNTISWASLGANYEYEIQQSTAVDFSAPASTGFISGTEHVFTGLTDGQTYHYRARARVDGITGAWSLPVRSTQDATPPSLSITPATGGVIVADSLALSGTGADQTSGISTLSVDGIVAATSDGFADWHWDVSGLQDGTTTFAITVQDQAVPPNTRTENWTVTRIANVTADSDNNGLGALLEYAFNASGQEAPSSLPQAATAVDSSTQERYLTVSYRRRLNANGLDYVVETSSDLAGWAAAGANAETLAVTPTGDGLTEAVLVRIHAPPGQSQTFVRVRVAIP